MAAGTCAFYIFARYRFPLVPPLLLFAGAAIVRGRERMARHDWRSLALPGFLLVLAAIVAHVPLIARDKQSAAGWTNLGAAAATLGRLDEASQYERKALEINPALPAAHYQLGNALGMKGRYAEAMAELELVLKQDPSHSDALNTLGLFLVVR